MQSSYPGWTVVASTPRADGDAIPFQIQIGYAPAPNLPGSWVAITRSVEPDGTQRKIVLSDPFSSREVAEEAANVAAKELHAKGVPMLFASDPAACTCLHCTIRHWGAHARSISRLCLYIGVALLAASFTFPGGFGEVVRVVSSSLIWFSTGASWSSYSLSKRIIDASR